MDKICKAEYEYEEFGIITSDNDTSAISEAESYEDKHGIFAELAKRIVDCISDGYDDEENREEVEVKLYNELSQIDNNSIIKNAFVALCERIEDLEM